MNVNHKYIVVFLMVKMWLTSGKADFTTPYLLSFWPIWRHFSRLKLYRYHWIEPIDPGRAELSRPRTVRWFLLTVLISKYLSLLKSSLICANSLIRFKRWTLTSCRWNNFWKKWKLYFRKKLMVPHFRPEYKVDQFFTAIYPNASIKWIKIERSHEMKVFLIKTCSSSSTKLKCSNQHNPQFIILLTSSDFWLLSWPLFDLLMTEPWSNACNIKTCLIFILVQ